MSTLATREFNNEVSDLLIQETVGRRLTHPRSFLRLLERNAVKESAEVMGRTKESRLSFSFFSFSSHLVLPSVTLLSFRLPIRECDPNRDDWGQVRIVGGTHFSFPILPV